MTASAGLTTFPAHAVWDIVPEVTMTVRSNDNVRMRPSEIDGNSTVLEGLLYLSNFGERGDIFIEPRFRSDSYSEDINSNLESDDYFLRSGGVYRWSQARLGFTTNFAEQNTTRSEIVDALPDDPDFDDPEDSDTGIVGQGIQTRERFIFRPYAQFDLTERSSLLLEARSINVSYNNEDLFVLDRRTGYDDKTLSFGVIRRADERNQITARFTASQFETELNNNITDSFGVNGEFNRTFSDIWSMGIQAGVQRSDYTLIDDLGKVTDNADTNLLFNLRLRRRGQLVRTNFDLGRRIAPNSSGFVTVRDELRVFAERTFSPRLIGTLAFRISDTKTVDNLSQRDDRSYSRVDAQIEWNITNQFYFVLGYSFTSQDFENDPLRDTEANAIRLGFGWGGRSRR